MKKLQLHVLLAVIFTFTSCELVKDLTDVPIEADYDIVFNVDLNADEGTVDEKKLIDLTEDEEAEKYEDRLEEVKLDSVTVALKSYEGEENNLLNGSLQYAKVNGSPVLFSSLTNLDLAQLHTSGKEQKVEVITSELDNITSILKKDKKIDVYLKGSVDKVPAKFDVKIVFYTTLIAQALD